ncbi:MAG: hypothetical protein F2873_06025, partial [Actinobacteria bacterium]|nr:hypothetical protein [Actinomycetota bacterium]
MIPSTDAPAIQGRSRRRRRSTIVWSVSGVLLAAAAIVLVVSISGSGSRSGTLVNGCDVVRLAQCPDADLANTDL